MDKMTRQQHLTEIYWDILMGMEREMDERGASHEEFQQLFEEVQTEKFYPCACGEVVCMDGDAGQVCHCCEEAMFD